MPGMVTPIPKLTWAVIVMIVGVGTTTTVQAIAAREGWIWAPLVTLVGLVEWWAARRRSADAAAAADAMLLAFLFALVCLASATS